MADSASRTPVLSHLQQSTRFPARLPYIGAAEFNPGRWWVLVNYPGRSSVSLCKDANPDLAFLIVQVASRLTVEAHEYHTGGAR